MTTLESSFSEMNNQEQRARSQLLISSVATISVMIGGRLWLVITDVLRDSNLPIFPRHFLGWILFGLLSILFYDLGTNLVTRYSRKIAVKESSPCERPLIQLLFTKMIAATLSAASAKGLWFLLLFLLQKTKVGFLQTISFFVSQFSILGWFLFGYLCIYFYLSLLPFLLKGRAQNLPQTP